MFLVFFCNNRYDMTQIHVEEGKREKERAEVIKRSPLFQRNTPTSVPTLHPTHMMLGEGRDRET